MSYISLYRKYRPKNFDEIVGQETVVKILKNSIKNNKISHAYIFSGPRGTGKTSIAKIFAKAVNCLNNKSGDLCGECDVCKNKTDNEIDIIEIDAASNNGVDEIREIRNNVKLLPSNLKYKVYIIDEVHMLSTSAFNALLKTLEEPPAHVIFILATTEFNKIPATVVSRCQKFDFKKFRHQELVSRLEYVLEAEKKALDPEIINLIATLSEGGMRDAINLLDQTLNINKKDINEEDIYNLIGEISNEKVFDILQKIVSGDLKESLLIQQNLVDEGRNFVNIATKLAIVVKNLIIYNNVDGYFDKSYENKLSKFIKVDVEKLLKLSSILFQMIEELKKSGNQNIISEVYFIKMTLLFKENDNNVENNTTKSSIVQENANENIEISLEKEEKVNKLPKIEEKPEEEVDEIKNIRINNALCGANKELKLNFVNKYKELDEYLSKKEYNALATLMLKATPEVVAENNIIFTFDNKFDVVLFNKNIEEIQKMLKDLYEVKYLIVAITASEWNKIKDEYILNIKNGIKYNYIEEKPKKTSKKHSELENNVENIFGDDYITVE